jgi:hypothetical protein
MLSTKRYAGIGSRRTPGKILFLMEEVGRLLASLNIELQSGEAGGADQAFERGCAAASGPKRIRLPWKGFNGSRSLLFDLPEKAFRIAETFHPAWKTLSPAVRKLMARSSFQVLHDLETPVDFLLCYTPGGSGTGGTGQALRIARHYRIPIFDFGSYEVLNEDRIRLELRCFLESIEVIYPQSKS